MKKEVPVLSEFLPHSQGMLLPIEYVSKDSNIKNKDASTITPQGYCFFKVPDTPC